MRWRVGFRSPGLDLRERERDFLGFFFTWDLLFCLGRLDLEDLDDDEEDDLLFRFTFPLSLGGEDFRVESGFSSLFF